MDHVIQHEPNTTTKAQLNTCRQYLKVLYLSDIANSDGTKIKADILIKQPNTSKYLWPRILPPNDVAWTTWKKYIKCHFLQDGTSNILKHTHRLGCWLTPLKRRHLHHQHYYSPQTSSIITSHPTQYKADYVNQGLRHQFSTIDHTSDTITCLPDDSIPADRLDSNKFSCNTHMQYLPPKTTLIRTW